jgi:tRNA (guanine-N7-)-methyltransferase
MDNVYAGANIKPELHIKTHYEGLDIAGSNRIHYLAFTINKELPLALDAQLKSLLSEHEPD